MYKHKKNNKVYIVINYDVKIQENNVWIDAVLYHRQFEEKQLFCRSVKEFEESFVKIG